MGKASLIGCLAFLSLNCVICLSSRIKITNNGYENIVISLPSSISVASRSRLITSLKALLQSSSSILLKATKGRALLQSTIFLVPPSWGDIQTWLPNYNDTISFEEAGALVNRYQAGIVVTNTDGKDLPYTLHHQGCGKQSLRIYIPVNHLTTGNLHQKSVEFVRLWSEFRYGLFPEGGFEEDEKYPLSFRVPGEAEDHRTECVNVPFRVPYECEAAWNCDKNIIKPSIMDPHYLNGTSFCEGHTGLHQIHISDAPTKQNLLCNEEGAYYIVLKSADFRYGRNAPLRQGMNREMTFRYIKESRDPRVFVLVDTSSRMNKENRYNTLKNAFSRFVLYDLPSGSVLNLIVYEGQTNGSFVTLDLKVMDLESRIEYLESKPIPDQPSTEKDSCPECVLHGLVKLLKYNSNPGPHVILVATQLYLNDDTYNTLVTSLKESDIYLHILFFNDKQSASNGRRTSWYSLCQETNNEFILLEGDLLGNLYSGFANSIKTATESVLIKQEYLDTSDNRDINVVINLDTTLTRSLTVTLSGPSFDTSSLMYDRTDLRTPKDGSKTPLKQNLLPAWIFHIPNPQNGEYILRTRRYYNKKSPVLLTVSGESLHSENSIIARVWVELEESQLSPPPVKIFSEVRKGDYPIVNANVVAYVHRPNNDGVSVVSLLDDGLGGIDITRQDGIYSHYFTNFTSKGFYKVRVIAQGGPDYNSTIRKGPSSLCCGSSFPSKKQSLIDQFQREAGPVTFEVTSIPKRDIYPPLKITDLKITRSYDILFVLQWSAVGNNYDTGVASAYEIKVFRDRSLIRNRFSDSGLEIHSETISTRHTNISTYGTTFYHQLKLSETLETGLYYVGMRASDGSGNYGEPSNSVVIRLHSKASNKTIICEETPTALGLTLESNSLTPVRSITYFLAFYSVYYVVWQFKSLFISVF